LIRFQGMLTEPGMVPRAIQSGVRESTTRIDESPAEARLRWSSSHVVTVTLL
jgi:hypothetical protein